MPEMDGLEATKQIRLMEKTTVTHVPNIAMTALAMQGDRETFLEAGMDGYVSKLIEAAAICEAVEQHQTIKQWPDSPPQETIQHLEAVPPCKATPDATEHLVPPFWKGCMAIKN